MPISRPTALPLTADRVASLLACFLPGLTLVVVRRLAGTKCFVVITRR